MTISLIVAMSENRVIGRDGQIPWHISDDLKRFKRLTMGHHIIMGRKTFESIGRPLPGRSMLVVTRQADYPVDDGRAVADLSAALDAAVEDDEVFIIGGGRIYELALPRVDRMYLTIVHAYLEGDVFFPRVDMGQWVTIEQKRFPATTTCPHEHTFRVVDRSTPAASADA